MKSRAQATVRAERNSDREAILMLLGQCGLPVDDLDGAHDTKFLVAVSHDALVGCVGIEPAGSDALLRSLAVSATERGEGTGSRLLLEAEEACRRSAVRDVYLLTLTAEPFFAHRGYRRVAREQSPTEIAATTEFASVCPVSSAFMTKHL